MIVFTHLICFSNSIVFSEGVNKLSIEAIVIPDYECFISAKYRF